MRFCCYRRCVPLRPSGTGNGTQGNVNKNRFIIVYRHSWFGAHFGHFGKERVRWKGTEGRRFGRTELYLVGRSYGWWDGDNWSCNSLHEQVFSQLYFYINTIRDKHLCYFTFFFLFFIMVLFDVINVIFKTMVSRDVNYLSRSNRDVWIVKIVTKPSPNRTVVSIF